MLDIERILKQDRLIRAMTGLNSKAFNTLLPSFTEAYEKSLIKAEIKRKRAMGGGRKATLREMQDKLFYILLYCKCYPTFDLENTIKKMIQWSCGFRQNFHKPFFKRGKTFNPCFNFCHCRFGEFNPRAINGF